MSRVIRCVDKDGRYVAFEGLPQGAEQTATQQVEGTSGAEDLMKRCAAVQGTVIDTTAINTGLQTPQASACFTKATREEVGTCLQELARQASGTEAAVLRSAGAQWVHCEPTSGPLCNTVAEVGLEQRQTNHAGWWWAVGFILIALLIIGGVAMVQRRRRS